MIYMLAEQKRGRQDNQEDMVPERKRERQDSHEDMLPEQKRRRYIPSEMVEEILVNLGVKSLARFCSVSKSWNSMISDREFIRRHRKKGAARIVSHGSFRRSTGAASSCISSIDNANATPEPLIFPFKVEGQGQASCGGDLVCPSIWNLPKSVNLRASCGDLWCVEYAHSIILWNPSTTSYKKLPNPSINHDPLDTCVFGLGYDSLGDDYKIVRWHRSRSSSRSSATQVYSLRSDSWRKIDKPNFHDGIGNSTLMPRGPGVACNGVLHWVMESWINGVVVPRIISYNLSTDKYDQVMSMPPQAWQPNRRAEKPVLAVFREKLCLHLNYGGRFVLFEMQEYGVAKSWTARFVINHAIFDCPNIKFMRPLYVYDDGRLLIRVLYSDKLEEKFFIFVDNKTQPQAVSSRVPILDIGYLYYESLVSPATYCTSENAGRI